MKDYRKYHGVIIGAALVGTLWGMVSCNTDPEVVTKTETIPIFVPDTHTEVVTKEVDAGPSKDCLTYIDAVQELMDAQRVLSQSKGRMEVTVNLISKNTTTSDPLVVQEVAEQVRLTTNEMNNAWNDIGVAKATVKKLQDSCK